MMWLSGEKMQELREKVNVAKEAMVDKAVDEITVRGYALLEGFVPEDVERVLNEIGIVLGNSKGFDIGGGLRIVITTAYLDGLDDREDQLPDDWFEDFPFLVCCCNCCSEENNTAENE